MGPGHDARVFDYEKAYEARQTYVQEHPEPIHSSGETFDPYWEDYYEALGQDENFTIPSWLTTAGKGALEFGAGMVGKDAPKGMGDSGAGGWM